MLHWDSGCCSPVSVCSWYAIFIGDAKFCNKNQGVTSLIKKKSGIVTHKFAANVHIHFIPRAFGGTVLHADKAVPLITRPILPVPVLQNRRRHAVIKHLFFSIKDIASDSDSDTGRIYLGLRGAK